MEIRPLDPRDDRESFSSGDPELDRFFRKYAGQNQFRYQIGTSYVAVDAGVVLGFATVAAGHIAAVALPDAPSRRLPRYSLPILRLARLAVSQEAKGRGIGSVLLYAVFKLALSQAGSVGCVGVVVDAKPQAIAWYARFGFQELPLTMGASPARPEPVAMFLPLGAIQAARE